MSINTEGAQPVALDVFGGLVTNIAPTALPEGSSPDCSDVGFLAGGVFSRPAFQKVFSTPFGTCTTLDGHSYVDPDGVIRNLYLDSNGILWSENISVGGPRVQITSAPPGTRAKFITAFGRCYIALSDGLHGSDIALQYDGTNIDRVTQGGPGAPPSIQSVSYPTVNMSVVNTAVTLAVSSTTFGRIIRPRFSPFFYSSITVFVASGALVLQPGATVTISGNTNPLSNISSTVEFVVSDTQFSIAATSATDPSGAGGTAVAGASATIIRSGNQVTVHTATENLLQPGYQALISGVPAADVGAGIVSVVIDNESNPGLATVTTTSPHGLSPGLNVSMQGITGAPAGGGIASIVRSGQVVTVTMVSDPGLAPGTEVQVAGVTDATFNGIFTVALVNPPLFQFTYAQVDVDASDSTGTVTPLWPVPATPNPTFYEVVAAPSPTTFQVQIFYSDGTFTGGTVSFAWDGIFFVQKIIDPNTFTYQQYGPIASSTTVGKVTPYGQMSPGRHQLQVAFLTRQGYITFPSPPVDFIINGGEYPSVSNIPIGPSNVIARILLFTGAQGAYFFYIPATPQVNGQIVGSSTQINDNTTTYAVLDFSDNTLFAGLGTSINGNNLANLQVLDSALGFGYFGSRLFAWGFRNQIQNMLNMGFEGGYLPSAPTIPNGWIPDVLHGAGGHIVAGVGFGFSFQFNTPALGFMRQSFYEDAYGAPIATANATYKVRFAFQSLGAGSQAIFTVASNITGFVSTFTFNGGSSAGAYQEITLPVPMPTNIPPDLMFYIGGANGVIDEISVINAESEFSTGCLASYVENPESFDGVSGVIGPRNDTQQVMGMSAIRSLLYMLTFDPAGRLHQTTQGVGEPVTWVVNEVADNCGMISAFCLTISQANDSTGAGGEEWFAWISSTGVRIFGGGAPDKISQEIQRPLGQTFPGAPSDFNAINPAANLSAWALNDPSQKIMYFGIPTGSATAPTVVFTMNYVGSDGAEAIAAAAPVRLSLAGQMSERDFGRKWAPWQRTMNNGALMYRQPGVLVPVFFGGNGATPVAGSGLGNVYTLNPAKYTDDDYGQFSPYYITYGFLGTKAAAALELGNGQMQVCYVKTFITGIGNLTLTLLYNSLANVWPITGTPYPLSASPGSDLEWGGGQCVGYKVFLKYSVAPLPSTTDNAFSITTLTMFLRKATRMPVRGVYP